MYPSQFEFVRLEKKAKISTLNKTVSSQRDKKIFYNKDVHFLFCDKLYISTCLGTTSSLIKEEEK